MLEHHHNHTHSSELTAVNKAFLIGIVLNTLFVIIEGITGFWTNSLALLTDAGHNLSDVASLALSLLAFRLAKVKATPRYTYGYHKVTILVALLNAVILLIAIGGISYEAILRFKEPHPIQGQTVAIVAFVGIIINSITAYFFRHSKENDLNVRSAYLHLAADALVSLGVVIGGITILYTNWLWLDGIISLGIAIIILISTWQLLTDSLRLSVDGVPSNVDLEMIKSKILSLPNIVNFTHIHIWAISTTKNALTAELVLKNVKDLSEMEKIKHQVKHELEHFNIHHSTIEVHTEGAHKHGNEC